MADHQRRGRPPTTNAFEEKENEATVVLTHLQTQHHLQGVVARHSTREEKTVKTYTDVVGRGGSVIDSNARLAIEWSRVRIPLRPLGNFGNFLYPTLPECFGSYTKSLSLLSGVYARGSKRSHTGGNCVTCRGLHTLPGQ